MTVLLLLALIFLPSCAWLQHPAQPPAYPLQTPGSYGGTYSGQHLLEGEYDGRRLQLQTYVEIDAEQIVIVGLTPWGTRAFSIRYDGQQLDFDNLTHRDMPLPPSLILSDVQQVLWPRLPNADGWRVEDEGNPRERRLYFRRELVTRITYAGSSNITLRNRRYGYTLHIRVLPPGDAG
jgi:hypothetical protein